MDRKFISNLKKPTCASKQDVLELMILGYSAKYWDSYPPKSGTPIHHILRLLFTIIS